MQSKKYITNKFKQIEQYTHDPEMYGKITGQLILGEIATYVFSNEATELWESFLLDILRKENLLDYISLKTIDKSIRPILENYLLGNSILIDEFNEKIQELHQYKNTKNFHYFTISNFITDKIYCFSNIRIGNYNHVCPKSGISFSDKIKENVDAIVSYHQFKKSYNESFFDLYLKEINELENKTLLEIYNFGDKIISETKSIKDAEHFVNELIFLRSLCSSLEFQIELNNNHKKTSSKPLFQINYENQSLSTSSQRILYPTKLDFNDTTDIQINIANFFKDLSFPLFEEEHSNELLEKLKTAIDWYASSFKANSNKESFLFCIIGMEALFSHEKSKISQNLAESTAFLIAKKDIQSRKKVFQNMKKLYTKRNGIAHGVSSNIEEIDLKLIRQYLSLSIIIIIKKIQTGEFYLVDDFTSYLDGQKFG